MPGCLRNVFAMIGCLTVVAVGAVVGYQYRAPLGRQVTRFLGRMPGITADTARAIGVPGPAALRSARAKEARLARADGPGSVVLTAEEMAAVIVDGLAPAVRLALDSLRVELTRDRFALLAAVRTDGLGRELLGPLSGVVAEREPLRMAGPAAVATDGIVAWRPDEVAIRAFPFPASLVSRMVDRLTGGTDGVIPIRVPTTVGEIRIAAEGVTFYRRTE
ncbi:MAG: hypothetical protein OER21_06505 [Gemmatimonadota bacterium]|nr:hypothetical protein [Gemmatimonadota bacterium]